MSSIFARCANFVLAVSCIWIPGSLFAAIPWVQRQLLYFNWLSLDWGLDMDRPETFGFLKGQVAPFRLTTKDGVSLYAWLIAPVVVYARHVDAFRAEDKTPSTGADAGPSPISTREVFKRLSQDPESKLIIYLHGNAATLAQERRTQEYRTMAAGLPDKLFVLTFDYRGFGRSRGAVPSEEGCTLDAIAAVRWAVEDAGVPPGRIMLHAHSLGTGIATAAAHHFAAVGLEGRPVEFAGVLLGAAFTDAAAAFQGFGFQLGVMPMAGLRYCPPLQRWFARRMVDKWRSVERIAEYVRRCGRVRLTLIHARSDGIMPWRHTEELFDAVLKELDPDGTQRETRLQRIELGHGGFIETWRHEDKIISKEIVEYGGHDTVMTWSPIALAILRTFELQGSSLVEDTRTPSGADQ